MHVPAVVGVETRNTSSPTTTSQQSLLIPVQQPPPLSHTLSNPVSLLFPSVQCQHFRGAVGAPCTLILGWLETFVSGGTGVPQTER